MLISLFKINYLGIYLYNVWRISRNNGYLIMLLNLRYNDYNVDYKDKIEAYKIFIIIDVYV